MINAIDEQQICNQSQIICNNRWGICDQIFCGLWKLITNASITHAINYSLITHTCINIIMLCIYCDFSSSFICYNRLSCYKPLCEWIPRLVFRLLQILARWSYLRSCPRACILGLPVWYNSIRLRKKCLSVIQEETFFLLGMQHFIFTCPLSKSRASSPPTKSIKQQLRIVQDKQNLRTVCSKGELRFFFGALSTLAYAEVESAALICQLCKKKTL